MDYWERKDQKTQLEHLNKRQRLANGGTVQQVAPGIYSPMSPGETMKEDDRGNRIYTPADQPPPPEGATDDPREGTGTGRPNILHGIQTN